MTCNICSSMRHPIHKDHLTTILLTWKLITHTRMWGIFVLYKPASFETWLHNNGNNVVRYVNSNKVVATVPMNHDLGHTRDLDVSTVFFFLVFFCPRMLLVLPCLLQMILKCLFMFNQPVESRQQPDLKKESFHYYYYYLLILAGGGGRAGRKLNFCDLPKHWKQWHITYEI